MQLAQFKEELATPDVDIVVMVGDLFDKPFVPLPVINEAVAAVVNEAAARHQVQFVFLAGNHDLSRQTGLKGAWELFKVAVSWLPNVHVLNEPAQIEDVAFFPWEWVGTAEMQVEYFTPTNMPVEAVVGHWDCVDFGNRDHMVPVKALQAKLGADINFYTGHDHGEGIVNVEGVNVIKTGSMQPYAHGEGDMYVTLTTAELAEIDPDILRNKCVRILLEPGEDPPQIDCLQLSYKRGEAEAVELEQVGIGAFNLHETLADEFKENDVPEPVQTFIRERTGDFA